MIINKIKFYNFRAYYKEVEFDFPFDANRNVSIIYANNDVGKSCFFHGIQFALYGLIWGQGLIEFINQNAVEEGNYDCYVSIFGEHNGKRIEITRRIKPRGKLTGEPKSKDLEQELTVIEEGKDILSDDGDEKNDYINSIVTEDASKYFFFDGEKIEAYNIASAVDYKEAITRILGIKEVENAIEDIGKLSKKLEEERDATLAQLSEMNDILSQKKDLEDIRNNLQNDIDYVERDIQSIRGRIAKHEEELKKHENIKGQVEEKQVLKYEIGRLHDSRKVLENKRLSIFKQTGTTILGSIIADRIRKELRENGEESYTSFLNESVKTFLAELTKQENCICGNVLATHNVDQINKYITEHIESDTQAIKYSEKRRMFSILDEYVQHAANAKSEYLAANSEKFRIIKELTQKEERLNDLKREIGSFDEDAGERIAREITSLEEKEKELEKSLIKYQTLFSERQEELEKLERQLSQFSGTNQKSSIIQKKLQLADSIVDVFEEYLDQLTTHKRIEVQQKATDVFLKLTNKPTKYKGLHITDNYTLKLELTDGSQYEILQNRPLNPSTGQSKIISLAYIAGINKSSNAIAPVVIDNPLGLFSDEHRTRVMEYLPKFGKQVICMVTQADLSPQYRRYIESYIKCEYFLEDKADKTWPKTMITEKKVIE